MGTRTYCINGVWADWCNYTQPLMVVINFSRKHSFVFQFEVSLCLFHKYIYSLENVVF